MSIKPVNLHLNSVTIQDIENHKLISTKDLIKDLDKLKDFDAKINANCFYGNKFLYHFQFKNLLKCKREDTKKTIYDIYNDPIQWEKLLQNTLKRNRGGNTAAGNVFECFRINLGSVVMFKSTTAKYLYNKYKAKNVLDPTAGWGGRMLGAWAYDINYTGIDTNLEMKPAYDQMISFLNEHTGLTNSMFEIEKPNLQMLWGSCLDVDFSTLQYDFVLTSPPYVNLEIYEHMTLWNSDKAFYVDFFIPLFEKCKKHIKKKGHICFNISPKMYGDAVKFGLTPCDIEEDLLQQLGQQKGKKKQDKIYIWKC